MIRTATLADLDALADLEAACFGDGAWQVASLRGELDRGFILLDDALRAYAIGLPVGAECELLRIGSHPSARRQGLGQKLLDAFHAESRARGITRTLLEVRDDNHPARTLYEAAGYTEEGRRRGYYPARSGEPRVDAVLYGLRLRSRSGG
jgi:ribosomal-protein-alanine N-acetyltransferase